ncbi:MAG TPA: ribokinase [Terriglobales bacterium]|nr:ribokinase [Terriglobales bacterium]
MSQPSITVVGSYATGLTMKVERLPSSGETLLGTGYRMDYGGKGSNQAVGCARLGARVSFVAKIGNDNLGQMALRLYREEGVDATHILQTADVATGVGFILVEEASGRNCIVLDPGANDRLSAADVSKCEAAFKSAAVVLTQLEIPVHAAEAALKQGRACRAITILNPAPVRSLPGRVLQLVDVLTPNEVEAKVLTGHSPDDKVSPAQVGRELVSAGVKNVVMTLGEKGALVVTESGIKGFPALPVRAVDTTGAGDAFNAGLGTAMAWGATLERAVELAIVTGGLAVTREGVIPSLPDSNGVVESYRGRGLAPPAWLATISAAAR